MEYQKVTPANQLLHAIESYLFLRTKQPVSFIDTFFPNGKPAIVFHFKSPFYLKKSDDHWAPIPSVGFIGCQAVPASLKAEGVIDSITVLLRPYSLYNLFQIKVDGLINYIDATIYFPEELLSALAQTQEINKRVELLDGFFIQKLKSYTPNSDTFKAICDFILIHKGYIERKNLSDIFSLSENYIHKLFIKKMGISFKPYARIVRIDNIIAEIYSNNIHDWIEILIRYGYFDQAHFIKDFKSITGKTPRQYYKSDKRLSSIFTGLA